MTSIYITSLIAIIIIIAVLIIDNIDSIIIYPVYLFEFINKQIDDEFSIKELNENNLLIDDDGFESLSREDLKKLRKEKIIPLYIKFSTNLNSYLYEIFKQDYIVLYKKVNMTFNVGDFIIINKSGNYYIREVCIDTKNTKVSVFKPTGKNTNPEEINRMDIVGKVVEYNKYRIGFV